MTPEQLTERIQSACGARLRSVVLYGSAAAGDHTGKRSDYNVLVVLDRIGIEELRALAPVTRAWVKKGNPPPLLFTRRRLEQSADVFPIEIADMKDSNRMLFGEDPVSPLVLRTDNLRWQIESELKSALLALRVRYLLTKGKPREVTELLVQSLTTFLVLARAALRLYTSEVPIHKMDALRALSQHVAFDTDPIETIQQLKQGRKVPGIVPDRLFADYIGVTETVVDAVDDFLRGAAKSG